MVQRGRQRRKRPRLTNLKYEYSSLGRGQNLPCHPTFGNSSRFCSQQHYFTSTLSGHKFPYQNLLLPPPPVTPLQKLRLSLLALPRALRRKLLHQPHLPSLTRKSQSTCPMYMSLPLLLLLYGISVLGRLSNAMEYHPIRCHTPHN